MNFSKTELEILLGIVDSHLNQYGGMRQIQYNDLKNLSDQELLVVGKMKIKYGNDYLNQLNIIQNKYNAHIGGASWLKKTTGVSAKPLKSALGQLGQAALATGVAIGTAKLAQASGQPTQPIQPIQPIQPTQPTQPIQPISQDLQIKIKSLEEENSKLKDENQRLKVENEILKNLHQKPVQSGGGTSHKVIIENTLYTIDSLTD
ncbi:hypothetical protein Indivirus_1_16 [Indivirus ILV1]|uniref:Uncharacterized protein n=1 Tax=Indivirus ILV1 TaxID=1977633 RepID=A0A1V0SCF2_9VIRU|nr:hypothetical protein Indivirus_1_16 [Indivirus ILV1]